MRGFITLTRLADWSDRGKWDWCDAARKENTKIPYSLLVGYSEGKNPVGRPMCRQQNNITSELKETEWVYEIKCIFLRAGTSCQRLLTHGDEELYSIDQCFSNWGPRKSRVPQRGVRCSKGRKRVMMAKFSATASMQTINRCFNLESSRSIVKSVRRAGHRQSQRVRRNDQVIDNFEVNRWCFTCNAYTR